MELQISELRKEDYKHAIQFAIKGMHLDWYIDNTFILNLYGRYFWYLEMERATQVFAVYAGETLAGVLLAEVKGECKKYHSVWRSLYVKFFDAMQHLVAGKGVDSYDAANKAMFGKYCESNTPDGEIIFLAANPDVKIKGIGTILLEELEKRERGKKLYLYTDNACTYQFYEHRGFERVGEKDVVLELGKKTVDLKCLLYSKTIGKHINNVLKEELDSSVVAKFATTADDGKTYQVEHYNLDMIISVGYRVKSKRGIAFRKCANSVLKDYIIKGYAVRSYFLRQILM